MLVGPSRSGFEVRVVCLGFMEASLNFEQRFGEIVPLPRPRRSAKATGDSIGYKKQVFEWWQVRIAPLYLLYKLFTHTKTWVTLVGSLGRGLFSLFSGQLNLALKSRTR